MQKINICWLRRDLRLEDNAALHHAFRSGNPVLPVFIFDRNILDKLDNKKDKRVVFIHRALQDIQKKLTEAGSTIVVKYGTPAEAFSQLVSQYQVEKIFCNHDYEPYAVERDAQVKLLLKQHGIGFKTYKDQVIFEKDEVVKPDGKPYTIFTPYSRKWKQALQDNPIKQYNNERYFGNFFKTAAVEIPSLSSMSFEKVESQVPAKNIDEELISHYTEQRNFPAIEGTSRLGVHLRFGTISIRKVAQHAAGLNETFLNELIWRDFYHMILWHFPRVGLGKAFKPAYDSIEWRIDNGEFEKWCQGKTGYPIVDAGMRQLNETGFMHNRVRMITASFLAKHLLLDWRLGEAYFAEKLLDFDLAANNGGWQWAAGSGCDAAPYFRIFNPYLQTKKFDPDLKYIKRWVPELTEFSYPEPIVQHEVARKRCLEVYNKALKK